MPTQHSIQKRRPKIFLIIFIAASFLYIQYYIQEIDSRFIRLSSYGVKAFIYYQLNDYKSAALEWRKHYEMLVKKGRSMGDDGLDALIKGDLQTAGRISEMVIKVDPFHISSLLNMGDIAFDEGRFEDALHYYQEAVKVNPINFDGLLGTSLSYAMLGAYNEAVDNLIVCLRTNYLEARVTSFLNVLKTLGYLEQNKIGEGSKYPFCLLAHIYRYLMIYDPWKADEAIAYGWKAISAGNRPDDAYITIGVMEQKGEKLKEALAHFLKAVEINPSNSEAYKKASYIYAKLGDLENEYRLRRAAFDANPQDDFYAYQLSQFLSNKFGDYYLALDYALKAYNINPQSVDNLQQTGWIYYSLGQLDKAVSFYGKALELEPENAYTRESLGMCYERQARYNEAIEAYNWAISLNPRSAGSYKGLGWIYLKLGEREKAIEALEKAVRLDPKDTNTLFSLGMTYHEVGRFEDAVKKFTDVLRIDPNHSSVNSVLPYTLQNIRKKGQG